MKEERRNTLQARHRAILSFWHRVEFFIPYDLQGQVLESKDADWSVRLLSRDQLERLDPQDLWSPPVPSGRRLSGFDVYLGIFDKVQLADITQRVLADTPSDDESLEQDERAELEGLTCAASLRANADGVMQLGEISVSTVPWALGTISRHGLQGLGFDAFQASLEALKRDVATFRSTTATPAAQDEGPMPCSPDDLLRLLDILRTWSGHDPSAGDASAPLLVIRAKSVEDKPKPEQAPKAAPPGPDNASTPEADDAEDDEAHSEEDAEISILNSFFVEDIARAIGALDQGTASAPLRAYLSPLPESRREDLYTPKGQTLISERLRPRHINRGHWPGDPAHTMSLMQQFAVNSIFEQVRDSGIFSVNGPPGTGKTTLLREIFAENIVRRARALSQCATPAAAFDATREVNFEGEKPCRISLLKTDLTGFEMVVASSNNAAVENISRDLPKSRSLGKPGSSCWRSSTGDVTFDYLRPLARNLLDWNGRGAYERPAADSDAWGLISCALGRKANREALVRAISVAGPRKGETTTPKGYDRTRHQSLWQWRSSPAAMSFQEARQAFDKADAMVNGLVEKLDRLASLSREVSGNDQESFCRHTASQLRDAQRAHEQAVQAFIALDSQRRRTDEELALLKAQRTLLKEEKPGWWASIFDRQRANSHAATMAQNADHQQQWTLRRLELGPQCDSAQQHLDRTASTLAEASAAAQARAQQWAGMAEQLERLKAEFGTASHPATAAELENQDWQIKGVWNSEQLNEQRANLFVAALQLHQAWLHEVVQTGGGFAQNIIALCHLLGGKRLQEPRDALAIWQSLFMIVPVVSSTFASVARQFRHLGPDSIGWLFIDEAGQAVPQAAVGALLRSRRAIVVGDPLQIEPVFTVPVKLLQALGQTSALPADMNVSPDKTSVQVLADEANPLGARMESGGEPLWIGSPLRVHRRCVEPMFSIANTIAYEGKMIFSNPWEPSAARPPADSLDIGGSAWVHAPGRTSDKQVVPCQIDLVRQALAVLYHSTGTLPPVYIISPFKRIKNALLARLRNQDAWLGADAPPGTQAPRTTELRTWCRERVGTVHTFQGKEESIVWMVLGCDTDTVGAAHWASSKPNLLNVAVTRAQHRCFLIGDTALWGGLRHFSAAHAEQLPRITPAQFLDRMSIPGVQTR
ncbi:DEAD/DEAH box helicase [Stenotrophomonas maltophilia]|uniref:DEAD/DEAH box helicase n=1 Tax=Stenotrophomonas maltophilia TaxID=40324 RepID=UPI0016674189|nr:AAA domain-containing protein [Stenotrophomonas maltophilia]